MATPNKDNTPDDPHLRFERMVHMNQPIGLVRRDLAGVEPLAKARMIDLDDEALTIEELHIAGRDVQISVGDYVECFCGTGESTLGFKSRVLDAGRSIKLNHHVAIKSVRITPPKAFKMGTCRTAYRAPLSARQEEFTARVWFIDRATGIDNKSARKSKSDHLVFDTHLDAAKAADPIKPYYDAIIDYDEQGKPFRVKEPPSPSVWAATIREAISRPIHGTARVIDLTPNGFGMIFYNVGAMQLHRFEHVVAQIDIGDPSETIEVALEIRQAVDLSDHRAKVGTLMVYPGVDDVHNPIRQKLTRLSVEIQRDELSRRRSGAA